jgi:parvulin-like peptidyl-prolyl isomerase
MKNALIFLIFLVFFSLSAPAQSIHEPLATVGSKSISVDEFKVRYELTPQIFREQQKWNYELKQEFLYTLIAEKLLAMYGESISLDTAETVKQALKIFEEMFVRDELYRQMVIEKAKFMADSLFGFYAANSTQAKLLYIRSESFEEINSIYNLLNKGVPFSYFISDSSLSSQDTLTITFGQFDELIENEILTLSENTISKPILIDDKWYIINSIKKLYPVIERTQGWESEYKRLKKLAKDRAEYAYYNSFMMKVFGSEITKANGKLLRALADEVHNLLSIKKLKDKEQNKFFMEASDMDLILNKLSSETLNSTFIALDEESITIKDFINFLKFENVSFDSLNQQVVFDGLNVKTKKFIEHKILAIEGYKLGLENTIEVQQQFNMWKQNYLYRLVLSDVLDSFSVTDEELKAYYNQINRSKVKVKEANIFEVVVRDPQTAEQVITHLESGIDISELKTVLSTHAGNINFKGESGLKPVTNFTEISPALNQMKAGTIYGPVKVSKGYSIFKLLEIKEDSLNETRSFAEIKHEIGNELRNLKIRDTKNKFIAKIAKENQIFVNNELLKSIPVTNHNSVAFKLLGFGGKITAVPLVIPDSEWYEEWQNSLKVIP